MEEEGTEEIINIFRGFAKYFKKAADVLEADAKGERQEQPKPLQRDRPQPMDWM